MKEQGHYYRKREGKLLINSKKLKPLPPSSIHLLVSKQNVQLESTNRSYLNIINQTRYYSTNMSSLTSSIE